MISHNIFNKRQNESEIAVGPLFLLLKSLRNLLSRTVQVLRIKFQPSGYKKDFSRRPQCLIRFFSPSFAVSWSRNPTTQAANPRDGTLEKSVGCLYEILRRPCPTSRLRGCIPLGSELSCCPNYRECLLDPIGFLSSYHFLHSAILIHKFSVFTADASIGFLVCFKSSCMASTRHPSLSLLALTSRHFYYTSGGSCGDE